MSNRIEPAPSPAVIPAPSPTGVAADALVGKRVQKYDIVRIIGRGGMGTVYEAVNTDIGKRVAMKFIDAETVQNADAVARFVRGSSAGWKSYLRDPAPANALIRADNPKMDDDQLASCVAALRTSKALTGGDAATGGIGVMTDARWRTTRDFLVRAGLLKETVDWRSAYTTQFCRHVSSGV